MTIFSGTHCVSFYFFFFVFAAIVLQNLNHGCFILASPIWLGNTDAPGAPIDNDHYLKILERFGIETFEPLSPLKHERRSLASKGDLNEVKLQTLIDHMKPMGDSQTVIASNHVFAIERRHLPAKRVKCTSTRLGKITT